LRLQSSVDSEGERLDALQRRARFVRKVEKRVGLERAPEHEHHNEEDSQGVDEAMEQKLADEFDQMADDEYAKEMGGQLWEYHLTHAIENNDTKKLERIIPQVCSCTFVTPSRNALLHLHTRSYTYACTLHAHIHIHTSTHTHTHTHTHTNKPRQKYAYQPVIVHKPTITPKSCHCCRGEPDESSFLRIMHCVQSVV
jgi:hypothetical protein